MKLKLLVIALLLVVGGGATAYSLGLFTPSSASATTYLTATAAVTTVSEDIAATGTVAAAQTWTLAFGSAPTASATSASSSSSSSSSSNSSSNGSGNGSASITWPVTGVKVAVGDSVTKGQLLATASTSDLDAQIATATRSQQVAHEQYLQAKDNRASASGTSAIRNANVQLLQAETSYDNARASLADLQAEAGHASLTAPADGVVTAVNVVTGQDAPSGTAITIASTALEITTGVVETDIPLITAGQKASVTLSAINQTVQGTVASIAPSGSASGNNGAVSFDVEVTLDTVPTGARAGMSASVTITTASATDALAIPSRALTGTAGGYSVRILNADGSVTVAPVQVGLVTSTLAQITSGIQAGDKVITGTSSQEATTTTTTRGLGGVTFGTGGTFGGGGFRGTNP